MKTRKTLVKTGEVKLSLEELHRRLWNWLAHNPRKHKAAWPCWGYNGGVVPRVRGDCFACEHTSQIGTETCKDCPVVWSGSRGDCLDIGAEYLSYRDAMCSTPKNVKACVSLAKTIAQLPWRGKPIYVKLLK